MFVLQLDHTGQKIENVVEFLDSMKARANLAKREEGGK